MSSRLARWYKRVMLLDTLLAAIDTVAGGCSALHIVVLLRHFYLFEHENRGDKVEPVAHVFLWRAHHKAGASSTVQVWCDTVEV